MKYLKSSKTIMILLTVLMILSSTSFAPPSSSPPLPVISTVKISDIVTQDYYAMKVSMWGDDIWELGWLWKTVEVTSPRSTEWFPMAPCLFDDNTNSKVRVWKKAFSTSSWTYMGEVTYNNATITTYGTGQISYFEFSINDVINQ